MLASSTSAKALYQAIQARLKEFLPPAEVPQHASWLLEKLFGISRMDLVLDNPVALSATDQVWLEEAVVRIGKQEPLQYVLGEAAFYGRMFEVNPAVLIPRPETEELVQQILSKHGQESGLKVLDVGTGSGCIAISLALELQEAQVLAIDVSEEALSVAHSNAQALAAPVEFIQADILKGHPDLPSLNIVVSNPPYVRILEASQMATNVMEWEPHLALFVEDHDPLLFYRIISDLATKNLGVGGYLYFEINEAFGAEVVKLLQEKGFTSVAIHQDMQGKDRMASALWLNN